MNSKKIILSSALLLALIGLFAAGRNNGWWNKRTIGPDPVLPEAQEQYLKILQQYKDRDTSVDLSGAIHIYDGEHDNILKERSSFRLIRSGRQYYMQLSYLQTFCDGIVTVQLDTVNRSITFSGAGSDPAKGQDKGMIDLLFNDTSGFSISGVVSALGRERMLRLKSDLNPGIRSCSLIYDTVSYRLRRTEIEWWKDASPLKEEAALNKVWVTKIDYSYEPFRGLDLAGMVGKIVTVVNGRVTPRQRYKDYQVNISTN